MSNRNLAILAIVALGMMVITGVMYSGNKAAAGGFVSGTPLIQGLAPEKVQKIVIKKGAQEVSLERNGDVFGVVEKDLYPVEVAKVNDLILKCMDVRCVDKITESAENHAELGVTEDSAEAVRVTFHDAEKKPLIGMIVGKTPENGRGFYVRLQGQDTTYLCDMVPRLDAAPMSYIETTPLSVVKDEIERVEVRVGEDSYALAADADLNPRFEFPPEGKMLNVSEGDRIFSAFSPLRIKDVAKKFDENITWNGSYTCRVKGGLSYTAATGEGDGRYFIKMFAEGPNIAEVQVSRNESEEELKKKEALILTVQKAQEFSQKHAGWIYEVGGMGGANLRRPLANVLTDKVDTAPVTTDKISASHILIGYQGTMTKATRSQDEASTLAEEVLAKAKAPGADFAALAKEYSDCPSAADGGALGTFERDKMDPAFAEAAFALQPGQMSGVVETQFGYHIILRTN